MMEFLIPLHHMPQNWSVLVVYGLALVFPVLMIAVLFVLARVYRDQHPPRAAVYKKMAAGYLFFLVVFQLAFTPFHLRLFAGQTVQGHMRELAPHSTHSSTGRDHHFRATVELPDGIGVLVEDVTTETARRLPGVTVVPVRLSPIFPTRLSNIGPGASAHTAAIGFVIIFVVALIAGFVVAARKRPEDPIEE